MAFLLRQPIRENARALTRSRAWDRSSDWFVHKVALASVPHRYPCHFMHNAAREALNQWLSKGPRTAAGRRRFTRWDGQAAKLALLKRAGSLVAFRIPRTLWGPVTAACVAERLRIATARTEREQAASLKREQRKKERDQRWQGFADAANRQRERVERQKERDRVFAAQWTERTSHILAQVTARTFAVIVAERHAMLTANSGKDRQPLAAAVETVVTAWVEVRARRLPSADLWQALHARKERAKASGVYAYALWPRSLTNAARRACELHTFTVRQSANVAQHVTA